jgi:hypothetical protein
MLGVGGRPLFVLFGSSIVQYSFSNGGWGAALADIYARKVRYAKPSAASNMYVFAFLISSRLQLLLAGDGGGGERSRSRNRFPLSLCFCWLVCFWRLVYYFGAKFGASMICLPIQYAWSQMKDTFLYFA